MDIKKLIAQFDDMEADNGMNITEEKLEDGETKKPTEEDLDDIYDAANILNKCEYFVETKEDLNILIKAQHILGKLLTHNQKEEEHIEESLDETKEFNGDKLDYLFNVKVSMDAENEMSNAFIKTEIKRAIENSLDSYDVVVDVENA